MPLSSDEPWQAPETKLAITACCQFYCLFRAGARSSDERNRIRIEQADLPLDANIRETALEVAPYYRSGVTLAFDVSRTRDALFRLLGPNGKPLPVGAVVATVDGELFPVGYNGEVFVTDLDEDNRLEARWNGQRCHFRLRVPDRDEPLRDLGDMACEP